MLTTYRPPIYCDHGVVATPHYLASLAGVEVLREGGNALDAAIAANAVLGVTWPHMCGIGGDLFLLVYWAGSGQLAALNASGRASHTASLDALLETGLSRIPATGGLAVTVPGAVDGWIMALERFGSRDLARLLAPAIEYAEDGFPVSAWLAQAIQDKLDVFRQYRGATELYAPAGRPPRAADRFANPRLAQTLRAIARQGRTAFYAGERAERIAEAVRAAGGVMEPVDLAAQRGEWVAPLATRYRELEVCELPPNTQGVAALQMFALTDGFAPAAGPHHPDAIHRAIEAKRLAFADRDRYVGEPATMSVDPAALLAADYVAQRRASIDEQHAAPTVGAGSPAGDGDTIYLCAVDRDGNAVSLIQSLFAAFGSGVVVPELGVVLHNRGAAFQVDRRHPNAFGPRKRPLHTLIPAMALDEGKPTLVFGTRGASGQPQTQLQVLSNLVDFGMNPQEAVEAPRWVHGGPSPHHPPDSVVLESRVPDVERVADDLRRRGHTVVVSSALDAGMGSAQVIQIDHQRGVLIAGSDPRADGAAIGW